MPASTPPDDPTPEPQGFSSPACLLHEGAAAPYPAAPPDAEGLKLWRKAKRAALIARRLEMDPADRAARTAVVTAALLQELAASPPALLGLYWPFRGEYDPRGLAETLNAQGVKLALPVVVQTHAPLQFRAWAPGAALVPGLFGIPVPADGAVVRPDVLLVPVAGFDRDTYRLGYGGGFYDRTLAQPGPRPRTIGVGFEVSRIPTIHPQPHDQPLGVVVTEAGYTRA